MTLRNRTKLNLRIVEEHHPVAERVLREAPEPGESIGAFLRTWRERRGWTIDQVAWVLRIRLVYLEAIEDGRLDELPGRIYITGFIRSYAKLLGVDQAAAVCHLRREYPDIDAPRELIFPEPPSERAVPGGAIMAVGVIAALLVYGGWYYQTVTSSSDRASSTSIPARLLAMGDAPADPSDEGLELPGAAPVQPPMRPTPSRTVLSNTAPVDLGSSSDPPQGTSAGRAASSEGLQGAAMRGPAPDPGMARAVNMTLATNGSANSEGGETPPELPRSPEPAELAGSPAALPDSQEGLAPPQLPSAALVDAYAATLPADMIPAMSGTSIPQTSASPSAAWAGPVGRLPTEQWPGSEKTPGKADGPIVLNAVEATWIEVREETGEIVTGKLLQPGDSYTVPSREGLKLTAGNAGGLEILVGGTAAPPLGPRGAVRRGIALDGSKLLAGKAARN